MAIRLCDRITTLLKADAHGFVESLEERSLLLKQYVREAEIEVNRKRARLEALRDEEKRFRDAGARREEEIRSLDDDIRLALAGGEEDLARFAIRRLLPKRSERKALLAQIEERTAEGRAIAERVAEQEAELEVLRTRVRAELARDPVGPESPVWLAEPGVTEEEVELELLRRRRGEEGGR
jgi:phage shock protein A